jgi:photosystem II stability/assembly factor-like uncharacterized protein
MRLRLFLCLLLAPLLDAATVVSLRPIRELTIVPAADTPLVAYARDDEFEYLGTADGLYRSTRIANAPLERIAFAAESINAIAIDGDTLYVSRGKPNLALATQPTLLRSRDHGVTFEAAGEGLRSCDTPSTCGYLIPLRIAFAPDRMFVSAAGNVMVSADAGATFTVLVGTTNQGKPAPQLCPVVFERIGDLMLIGGECPLDVGYLARGILQADLLGWDAEPVRFTEPEMENRNVQFIRDEGDGIVYAAIEGAILKSTDNGSSFRYVLHYPSSGGGTYPYLRHFAEKSASMFIGGFDKATSRGYLAYSSDDGESWIDTSNIVSDTDIVSMLAIDADGRLLVATYRGSTLRISEIITSTIGKTRSVRH